MQNNWNGPYIYGEKGQDLSSAISYADYPAAELKKQAMDQIIDRNRDMMVTKHGGKLETERNGM